MIRTAHIDPTDSNAVVLHDAHGKPTNARLRLDYAMEQGRVIVGDPTAKAAAPSSYRAPILSRPTSKLQPTDGPVVPMRESQGEADQARYAKAVLALPEAQDRPVAAQHIAAAHNARSMPLDRARRMLLSLPNEVDAKAALFVAEFADRNAPQAETDPPKLRRAVQIKLLSATLSSRERAGLRLALSTSDEMRITLSASLRRLGFDAAAFTPTEQ